MLESVLFNVQLSNLTTATLPTKKKSFKYFLLKKKSMRAPLPGLARRLLMVCEVYRRLRNFLNLTNCALRCGMLCSIVDSDCKDTSFK